MKAIHTYHAYVIFAHESEAKEIIDRSIPENAQIQEYRYDLLGVNQVAEIQSEFQEKQQKTTWVVIYAERMSNDAQNKFLKTLEEPVPNVVFVLVFPKSVQLISTVLSRVVVLRTEISYENLIFSVKDFLKKTVAERLDMIDEMGKERKGQDDPFQPYEVQAFLDALESGLQIMFHKKPDQKFSDSFAAIRQARQWSQQVGIPQKNLLDYVAIFVDVF